jgi:hypothetical protein
MHLAHAESHWPGPSRINAPTAVLRLKEGSCWVVVQRKARGYCNTDARSDTRLTASSTSAPRRLRCQIRVICVSIRHSCSLATLADACFSTGSTQSCVLVVEPNSDATSLATCSTCLPVLDHDSLVNSKARLNMCAHLWLWARATRCPLSSATVGRSAASFAMVRSSTRCSACENSVPAGHLTAAW